MSDPETADITFSMSREVVLLLMTAVTIAAETCPSGSPKRHEYDLISRELRKAINNEH